jgi:hypothetical protein
MMLPDRCKGIVGLLQHDSNPRITSYTSNVHEGSGELEIKAR